MNYIVLDLEWNQSPGGKARENPRMPFEIIEIGAIKLNDRKEEIGRFHELVKPLVYHHLHYRMKEVVPLDEKELRHARTFSRVIRDFLAWCGEEEYRFVTWGPMDLNELQRNMDYYRIRIPFEKPLLYYDLQKLYSLLYDDGKSRVALDVAIDAMDIEKDVPFHRALDDTYYTAQVMRKMDFEAVSRYVSVDYHRLPDNPEEEITLDFHTYMKYVSRPFPTREAAMADKTVTAMRCSRCRMPVWKRLKWFSTGGNVYLSLVQCPRHGYIKGKLRIKKTPDGRVFAVKTMKPADAETVATVKAKREQLQEKRRRVRHNRSSKKKAAAQEQES